MPDVLRDFDAAVKALEKIVPQARNSDEKTGLEFALNIVQGARNSMLRECLAGWQTELTNIFAFPVLVGKEGEEPVLYYDCGQGRAQEASFIAFNMQLAELHTRIGRFEPGLEPHRLIRSSQDINYPVMAQTCVVFYPLAWSESWRQRLGQPTGENPKSKSRLEIIKTIVAEMEFTPPAPPPAPV